VKYGFSIEHVSSNDNGAVKLSEDEEDGWYNLQLPGVQFHYYTTCDSVLEASGIQSVNQV
jgi:hypothetical protein